MNAHPPSPAARAARAERGELAQAALMLLPALALAWPGPGALLRGVFDATELTATGVAALFSLPACFLLALRRPALALRGLGLLLAALILAVGWTLFGELSDTLEASRALSSGCTALALLLSGASLGERGRRLFFDGAIAICLLLTLYAALAPVAGRHPGILGNAGELSSAALIGAVLGATRAVSGSGARRVLGVLALIAFLWHARLAGLRAGPLALCGALSILALALAAARSRTANRSGSLVLGVQLALVLAVLLLNTHVARDSDTTRSVAAASSAVEDRASRGAGDSGLEVRLRIWPRALSLFADHPLLGVGPGQFAAQFPPYRDPAEIELSSHGRLIGAATEVEHPHNDALSVLSEGGVLGGGALLLFFALTLGCALSALFARSALTMPAMATLAVAVDSLVNAPLAYNPSVSIQAFACFGMLLGAAPSGASAGAPSGLLRGRTWPVFLPLIALIVGAPRAWSMIVHGRALSGAASLIDREIPPTAEELGREVERALEACPDSAVARTLEARLPQITARGPSPPSPADWQRVLELRPHRVEALIQVGVGMALKGRLELAREHLERARGLDPTNPILLRNLVRLESDAGRVERAAEHLDSLESDDRLDSGWASQLASELFYEGHWRAATSLASRVDARIGAARTGEELYALSKEHGPGAFGEALESHAHRLWANDHAEHERYSDAVRSYRQTLRLALQAGSDPKPVRLELVAALQRAGREKEARDEAQGIGARRGDWDDVAPWARRVLKAPGYSEPGDVR